MNKSSLKVSQSTEGTQTIFQLQGAINESSSSVLNEISFKNAILDLNGISRVNSSGAQHWLQWVRNLGEHQVFVRRIPPPFVHVLNVLHDLIPSYWVIESFHVPYMSKDGSTEYFLYKLDQHFTRKALTIPARVSSLETGKPLELDVHPDLYFYFLSRRSPGFETFKPF